MIKDVFPDLEATLKQALLKGVSYADARFQSIDSEQVTVDEGSLRTYSSRRFSGVGVRVALGKRIGFAATSDLTSKGLLQAVDNALASAKPLVERKKGFEQVEVNTEKAVLPVKKDPFAVPPEEKVSLTLDANKSAKTSEDIRNVLTTLGMERDFRWFISTEGADVTVDNTAVGLTHASSAKVKGVMERVSDARCWCAGYEFIEAQNWNTFTEELSSLAIESAGSKTPPPGTYPVVVPPSVIGLVLHEAFGHASEGDFVYTGESVLYGKLGARLASDLVTIVDQGVVEGGRFLPFDDEGIKKQKTMILDHGVMSGYIHDRNSSSQFGVSSTGNGRAQDFENAPVVRQTNYCLEPRNHGFEEMLEGIDYGIYLGGIGGGGGQVSVGTGTFTFRVGPSRVIRKGELAETVRGVVISGLVLETLKTIDAVGKDFQVNTSVFGGCGKKNQTARCGMGGPHVRVRQMTIGGR